MGTTNATIGHRYGPGRACSTGHVKYLKTTDKGRRPLEEAVRASQGYGYSNEVPRPIEGPLRTAAKVVLYSILTLGCLIAVPVLRSMIN